MTQLTCCFRLLSMLVTPQDARNMWMPTCARIESVLFPHSGYSDGGPDSLAASRLLASLQMIPAEPM
jgi:hypothetical protein